MSRPHWNLMQFRVTVLALLACGLFMASPVSAQSDAAHTITLVESGRALCQIVRDPDPVGLEEYAAQTLAGYLQEMTGAEFPVVTGGEREADRPAIFVGLSEPAIALLGPDPLANLRDQEHVACSVGPDILLYGKGHRASLDAVMEFLENSLGWRWYSPFERPVVPKRATLTLEPFSRKRGFDFESRQLALRFNAEFYLQHGVNMGLPEGEKLPDNLVIDFAPIEDCYFADWTHPDPKIQETFQHLKEWAAITAPGNVWAWMYPNPWGTGHEMPVGNVQRVITNMRRMHQAGVRGIFLDHNGLNSRSGWSELQAYLVLKLSQDIDADTDSLMAEFTDHAFGPAAPQMRRYLAELEAARQAITTLPPGVSYKSRNLDDRTFPYLTPANVHRWQQLFEQMEAATANLPRELANVRSQRRELDIATLWKWFDLRASWPDVYTDHRKVAERVLTANKAKSAAGIAPAWTLGEPLIAHFATLIDAGGEKPLPAEFDGIARERIRTFLPQHTGRGDVKRSVQGPDAAFGTTAVVDQPQVPFRCGFSEWKSRVPSVVTHGPRLEIERDQITPGEYRLYRLGEIDLTTDDSLI